MRNEKLMATLFAVIALMFSYSTFAEGDDPAPCSEGNECEELVVTG